MKARKGSEVAQQILKDLCLDGACSDESEIICEALVGKILVDEAELRSQLTNYDPICDHQVIDKIKEILGEQG